MPIELVIYILYTFIFIHLIIAESDEINNLENEIKVLTREGDILEATNKNFQDHNQDLAAEIEKLKADISRLRNSGINYELQNV